MRVEQRHPADACRGLGGRVHVPPAQDALALAVEGVHVAGAQEVEAEHVAGARAEGCLFGRKFSAVPLDRWRALVLGDEKGPDAEAPAEEVSPPAADDSRKRSREDEADSPCKKQK